jgi:hypothetical protein
VVTSRKLRWVKHVACKEEMRKAYKILFGEPQGKKILRKKPGVTGKVIVFVGF